MFISDVLFFGLVALNFIRVLCSDYRSSVGFSTLLSYKYVSAGGPRFSCKLIIFNDLRNQFSKPRVKQLRQSLSKLIASLFELLSF